MNIYPTGALSSINNAVTNSATAKIAAAAPAAATGDATDRDADGRQQWDEFEQTPPTPVQPDEPPPADDRDGPAGEGHIDLLA